MEQVECFSCHRKFEDDTLLLLHQQYESCLENNLSLSKDLICPMCDRTFSDHLVLQIHINEDHDQPSNHVTTSNCLYAQDLERRQRMKNQYEKYKQQTTSVVSHEKSQQNQDEQIAQMLQDEENDDARIARMLQDEENAQSFEEFQNRYGGSKRTFSERARWNLDNIFKKKCISQSQYDEYKIKLDDMIANPFERMESRSTNLIEIISKLSMNYVADRRLCRPGCDHVSATWLDQGWACGYKNFQMLLSSLRHDPQYSTHLFGQEATNRTNLDIPSVSHLQQLIEKAWNAGFDSEGREQLNGHLTNSTKWIGPTELMACLANLNIKTELFDFHQPKNLPKSSAYNYLFEWIKNYFQQQGNRNNIIHPLYLQHEGHSRTVVGYEQLRNNQIRLLIFDPSTSKQNIEQFRQNPYDKIHLFRRSLQSFQKPVYQILVVRGLLNPDEKEAAKKVRSTKVPTPNS